MLHPGSNLRTDFVHRRLRTENAVAAEFIRMFDCVADKLNRINIAEKNDIKNSAGNIKKLFNIINVVIVNCRKQIIDIIKGFGHQYQSQSRHNRQKDKNKCRTENNRETGFQTPFRYLKRPQTDHNRQRNNGKANLKGNIQQIVTDRHRQHKTDYPDTQAAEPQPEFKPPDAEDNPIALFPAETHHAVADCHMNGNHIGNTLNKHHDLIDNHGGDDIAVAVIGIGRIQIVKRKIHDRHAEIGAGR